MHTSRHWLPQSRHTPARHALAPGTLQEAGSSRMWAFCRRRRDSRELSQNFSPTHLPLQLTSVAFRGSSGAQCTILRSTGRVKIANKHVALLFFLLCMLVASVCSRFSRPAGHRGVSDQADSKAFQALPASTVYLFLRTFRRVKDVVEPSRLGTKRERF